jgi:hypothetical protein
MPLCLQGGIFCFYKPADHVFWSDKQQFSPENVSLNGTKPAHAFESQIGLLLDTGKSLAANGHVGPKL